MSLFPSKFYKDVLLTQLRTLGVVKVDVPFSGGGDNGDIDEPILRDSQGRRIEPPKEPIEWPTEETVYSNNTWHTKPKLVNLSLADILRAVTNDALEKENIDWYNNDGGQGMFTIDFSCSPPAIELDVGINTVSTEDFKFNFSDED